MLKARQQRTPIVIAFTVAVGVMLAWPAWTASRNGLSDLHARPAIDYLKTKRFDPHSISKAEWQAIENSITHADKLMPRNPQYLEALGWLNQIKLTIFAGQLSIEEKEAYSTTSRYYFRKAIESRPTWPYYWGNLALEHYRRGNYESDEYSLALANASRFGPWKNDMQRLVMDLGGETWEFLSLSAKREYILSTERGLHRQPQNTVRIVNNYNALPILCDANSEILDVPLPHLQTLCAKEHFAEQADPP